MWAFMDTYKRERMFPKNILAPRALCTLSNLIPSMTLHGCTLIHLLYMRHTKHKTQKAQIRPCARENSHKKLIGDSSSGWSRGLILTTIPWRLVRYRFPHKLRKLNLALNSVIQLLPLKIVLAAPQVTDLYFVVQHSLLFDNISNI